MKNSNNGFHLALRILVVFALIGYVIFLIDEKVPLFSDPTFADISVYLLFIVFLIGFSLLWKNEFIAGIILIVWHLLQWCLVLWLWEDGGMTLVFGFPIALLGFLILNYSIKQREDKA